MSFLPKFSLAFAVAALAVCSGHAQSQIQPNVFVPPPEPSGCPVALRAQHSPGLTERVPVGSGGTVSAPVNPREGQHMQLRLRNSRASAISAVRIRVHGWRRGTAGSVPLKSNSDIANATRTLNLTVKIAPHATARKDVWVSGLASVDSIDVDEVSYADGSTWTPKASEACRIVPDPLMLVSRK